jgi:UDP-N-acetylglucosamine 2-epimerase (non-hydrolysing)
MKRKVSIVFGTRPEAIKLCPIILELRKHPDFEPRVCVTAQHREMLDQVLEVFSIEPDTDLNLMEENQSLASLSSRSITALDIYFKKEKPDLVIVQGDTTTTFIASLSAFYNRIPIGHVEAGLRTSNKDSPFPEEINRVLTSHIADLHFAPTEIARQNLLKEGIPAERIFVTGNTVIDALFFALEKVRKSPPEIPGLPSHLMSPGNGRKIVLITGHRRESFGKGFQSICEAISQLASRFPEVDFIYPVHLNPNVQKPVFHILGNSISKNIHLIEPLPYLQFVALMNRAAVILTDSGGIQEEAPSFGKPVLVMREATERPEAIEAGAAKLVGTDKETIVEEASRVLMQQSAYEKLANAKNPYGDGHAAPRIVDICSRFLFK